MNAPDLAEVSGVGLSARQRVLSIAVAGDLALAALCLLLGHQGAQALSWTRDQVSTFAARAPLDGFVTIGMLLAAGGLVMVGLLLSWAGPLRERPLAHVAALLFGASSAGLALLATFEETAPTIVALRASSFEAIRQQSFHDAGLGVFFVGAVAGLIVAGALALTTGRSKHERLLSAGSGLAGILAPACMHLPWALGLGADLRGLQQRLAFVTLGLGALLLVAALGQRAKAR